MRVVFMGTPQFAIPSLNMLVEEHELISIITQPDRPAGRGKELQPSRVKLRALELGLDVSTPASLKGDQIKAEILGLEPDLVIVAAFGQLLPEAILDGPRFGALNVHASLLPRWRGAAPIQAAILAGDSVTGITIMKMDAGLDTGPILSRWETGIQPGETGGKLSDRLAIEGARLLLNTIEPYASGGLQPIPQDESLATYAAMLKKKDGLLQFNLHGASQLGRQVRAYNPWPGSFFHWKGIRLGVSEAAVFEGVNITPGEVALLEGWPVIGCVKDALRLVQVHPAGRRAMSGEDFIRGAPGFIGSQV
jgi:methionyl-tRNA formyltransferase